jgi:sugar/nucleoside kinase (ribokinase family)
MNTRITTIGNVTIDDIVIYDTQKMFLNYIGGDSLFSAIGGKIWDASPLVVARVGQNFPDGFDEQVQAAGIKTSFIKVRANDIHNWALYEPGGARQFINHLTSGSHYDMSITAAEIPMTCLESDGIHLAPMPTDVQFPIIEKISAGKKAGQILSWDPQELYLQEPRFNELAYKMLESVDLFLPSREEIYAMCGKDDLPNIIRRLAPRGPRAIAVKMSTEGSLVYDHSNGRIYHVPVYPSKTVDPTGAGDSFCGGFLAAFVRTGDALESACHGTVAASYVVEAIGALNTFSLNFSDLQQRLDLVKRNVRLL